ncbi:hypothetical protein [Streptomyces sp. NPDC057702]|uniref:hypothetical protein n=1 Tax=unclassified Streptomyces TaxID=2593676 RepID=UPI00367C896E
MTSTTDTDEHPEVAEISALSEGVLPPDRVRPVREHLAVCSLCADVQVSLEEIRGALGTLPGPARMPADIAGRIDAALAAEALLDATAGRRDDSEADSVAAATLEAETLRPAASATADESDAVSRETTPEPLAVSRETSTSGPSRPPGRARSATGPGRQSSSPRLRSGRHWRKALLGTACAAAVLGVGTFLVQNGPDDGPASPQRTAEGETRATTLTAASLEGTARTLLAATEKTRRGPQPSQDVGTNTSSNAPLGTTEPSVPACVRQGTQRLETPLAARKDVFGDKPAYLLLLPHPGDDSRVDAFVVDATCVRESPSPPGAVLLQRSLTRD